MSAIFRVKERRHYSYSVNRSDIQCVYPLSHDELELVAMTQTNQDKDYFHINRKLPYSTHQLLKIGDSIDVGGESNPYFRFYEKESKTYQIATTDGHTIPIPGVKFIGEVKFNKINYPDLPTIAHDVSMHLAGLVGELIWEDIMKKGISSFAVSTKMHMAYSRYGRSKILD